MKYLCLFLFIPFLGASQVADTLYLEQVTDSTVAVVRQITYRGGAQDIKKTEALDTAGAVLFLTNVIHDNELPKVSAAQNLLETAKLDRLYSDVNGALNSLSGQGFLPTIWPFVKEGFKGVWRVQNGAQTIWAFVNEERQIIQITAASRDNDPPTPVNNGFTGAFWGVTRSSFIPKNFLPETDQSGNVLIPDGERFYQDPTNEKVYRALNSPVVFRKYK